MEKGNICSSHRQSRRWSRGDIDRIHCLPLRTRCKAVIPALCSLGKTGIRTEQSWPEGYPTRARVIKLTIAVVDPSYLCQPLNALEATFLPVTQRARVFQVT